MKKTEKANILLIEDSQALARVYLEYLAELQAEVRHVTEGREGLEAIALDHADRIRRREGAAASRPVAPATRAGEEPAHR